MNQRKIEQVLCVLPWLHLHVDEKGAFLPCCNSKKTPFQNQKNSPILFQDLNSFYEIKNSSTIINLKKEMLNGIRPDTCESCYKNEELNIVSYRQTANTQFPTIYHDIVDNKLNEFDFDYRWFDLRLGNLCNLKCRMCYPQSSNILTKDHFLIYKKKFIKDLDFDWYLNLNKFDEILKNEIQLERLHFAGGEPLLIKEGFLFLEKLIELNKADKIEITYNTNLSYIPNNAFSIWKNFKKVTLIISIDGTDQVNHYIRFPSDWHKLIENISRVENANFLNFNFHVTVQAYNILNLKNLIRFFEPYLNKNIYPRFDFVNGAEHFSIAHLPQELKDMAISDLELILKNRPQINNEQEIEFQNNLKGIIKKLNEKQKLLKTVEFIRVTYEFDKLRDQSLISLYPEFKILMKNPYYKVARNLLSLLKSLKTWKMKAA